jgi:N-acetylneuraminic acid mutarotase
MNSRVFSGVAFLLGLAFVDCGGGQPQPPMPRNPSPPTSPVGLWARPIKIAIAQGSSETIAIGTGASVSTGLQQSNPCKTTTPTSVQVSGVPEGVTVSPLSPVIPADCSPVPVTFSVSSSAPAGSAAITLVGTSGNFGGDVSLPFFVMPASATPTAKCTNSPASPTPNPNSSPGEWTWMNGSHMTDVPGTYGSEGIAALGNSPGGRDSPAAWTDASGAFWLFGGYGAASTVPWGDLNDLWQYSNGEWTWVGGSSQTEQSGVYGTEGVASASNIPGARWEAASWTDHSGNFWLFGGLGLDSTGARGDLNDLWKYDPATYEWAWMAGASNICDTPTGFGCSGVYGTEGTGAPSNAPGARVSASSWTDSCGNLWLFGGEGNDSPAGMGGGLLNDLWKYDPTTNLWTWMSGANINNQNGTYGTLGAPAAGNVPGSRTFAASWTDKQGNLWLFGGIGGDVNGITCMTEIVCVLNDLWEYNPATSTWTWMGGSDTADQTGVYGAQGVASSTNTPGARSNPVSWTDAQGNLWLFGGNDGLGVDSDMNDLWEYRNGQWVWVSGSNQAGQTGTYGTSGVAAPANVPGARQWAAGWIDPSGDLWLFGGDDISEGGGKFNDLWEFQP